MAGWPARARRNWRIRPVCSINGFVKKTIEKESNMHIYIYIYVRTYAYVYAYIYIYIYV